MEKERQRLVEEEKREESEQQRCRKQQVLFLISFIYHGVFVCFDDVYLAFSKPFGTIFGGSFSSIMMIFPTVSPYRSYGCYRRK
ncbi:MAG TPA: hypothetical protein DEB17_07600 [Chlorobaculum sp.]|uniref:Transmembrane protein n=1 Tax=Chlorobaculum tepidum (strain ATCC 49652 / DSM 12025 / NBRC 103806 / TLS) TaxID=194439 RepID=Q8KFG1_CHLTE|nr:hypothetical protein CT0365 [Chlorobaculum tepidum TLS]HBU23837.1 hypothetical protein [Chlorobaculum sp.]